MKIGIVAEFNPLHSGHEFLINEAKKFAGNDGKIICVMSEFFTQRGEIAVLNGYHRAECAVKAGCDLVLALPYRASVSYSDHFAQHSIEILIKCGITHLIFGTEIDINCFEEIYQIEKDEYTKKHINSLLKEGLSYPKIMQQLFDLPKNNPNFILAYSYYKAIKNSNKSIKLIPIQREGQKLTTNKIEDSKYLSATSIRNNLNNKKIKNYLSPTMFHKLKNNKTINEDQYFELLKYKILSSSISDLKQIYDIKEGLENRIYKAALEAKSYLSLVDIISSKRYSKKRIQRILTHILTSSTSDEINQKIDHVRILAVKKDKTNLIREINNNNEIKLHQKLKKDNAVIFNHDVRVARIYNNLIEEKDIFKENIRIID